MCVVKAPSGGVNCVNVTLHNVGQDDVTPNMLWVGMGCLGTDLCPAAAPPLQSLSGTRCSGEPCCRSHQSC